MKTRIAFILVILLLLSAACATPSGDNSPTDTPDNAAPNAGENAAPADGSTPDNGSAPSNDTTGSDSAGTGEDGSAPSTDAPAETGVRISSELDPGSACYNTFMPVNRELTWRYFASFTGTDPTQFTIAISDLTTDGMTSTMTFPEFSSMVQWQCGPEGLFSSEFAQFTFAMMPGTEIETISYDGITLPDGDLWAVGYSWSSNYQININMTIQGIGLTTQVNGAFNNEITAIEEVSVPAGTYPDGYRVQTSGTLTFDMFGSMIDIPIETTTWYVPDVGMVKSVSTDEVGTSTIELLAIE